MKVFNIPAALTILGTLAHAAPNPAPAELKARQPGAFIRFEGAPPDVAFYTQSVPTDGSLFNIEDPLSISHIASAGGATCTFFGIDGSVTTVVGAGTVDVGPPQTQTSGRCSAL